MIGFFLQTSVDTVAQAVTNVANTNTTPVNEGISVFEFILKGGFFLIPIGILLFYTFYVCFNVQQFRSLTSIKFIIFFVTSLPN